MVEKTNLKDALEKCVQEVQSWPMWKQMLARGEDFRLPQVDALSEDYEEQSSG